MIVADDLCCMSTPSFSLSVSCLQLYYNLSNEDEMNKTNKHIVTKIIKKLCCSSRIKSILLKMYNKASHLPHRRLPRPGKSSRTSHSHEHDLRNICCIPCYWELVCGPRWGQSHLRSLEKQKEEWVSSWCAEREMEKRTGGQMLYASGNSKCHLLLNCLSHLDARAERRC